MNRRDFLKMIGVGLTSLGLGKLAIEPVEEPVPIAEAEEANSLTGQWHDVTWLQSASAGSFSFWAGTMLGDSRVI